MTARKTIGVLISCLDVGGAEMDLLRCLPLIDRDLYRILVYTAHYPGALADRMVEAGIEVWSPRGQHRVGDRCDAAGAAPGFLGRVLGRFKVGRFLASLWPYVRWLRHHRPDIIHAILPTNYLRAMVARWFVGCPPVIMARVSLAFFRHDFWAWPWIEGRLHRRVACATGNSHAILRELMGEGLPPERCYYLPNGVDMTIYDDLTAGREEARRSLGVAEETVLGLVIANLHPYKGHRTLVDAAVLLQSMLGEMPWKIVALGRDVEGSLERFRAEVMQRGLQDRLVFFGPSDSVPQWLSAADFTVHPSLHEGLPNSVMEAMATGLPVVASEVGGIPELISDTTMGLLVPPSDPEALSKALCRVIESPTLRRKMGESAKAKMARDYSMPATIRAYETLYRRVVEATL
jgi:glycosyltransferase involved in cell wall biosynthesis